MDVDTCMSAFVCVVCVCLYDVQMCACVTGIILFMDVYACVCVCVCVCVCASICE